MPGQRVVREDTFIPALSPRVWTMVLKGILTPGLPTQNANIDLHILKMPEPPSGQASTLQQR
jgi:hypothetical protein